MSGKGFASANDLDEKKVSFDEIGRGLYAFTAEGDPNSGVIVGDDSVMVVDAQATPVMALEVIERVRKVTDKPIKHVLLTHYHAVRVLGASAYPGRRNPRLRRRRAGRSSSAASRTWIPRSAASRGCSVRWSRSPA